jgi:hypothetical protein
MSDDASAAPAEGPLSVDQGASALAALRSKPAPAPEAVEAPVAEAPTESEAEPTAEVVQAEPSEATSEDVQAEALEPAQPALEPPPLWDAEAKEKFRDLSPEHQAIVLAQTDKGDRHRAKAVQEAAERAKHAEDQARGVKVLSEELNTLLPEVLSTFKSRWEGMDWVTLARDDPGQYVAYKAEHDAEQVKLQGLHAATQRANAEARAAYVRQESAALATLAPELVDPKEGPARQQKLIGFLKDSGVSDEDLSGISAVATALAYDAMRYREASAKPLPKPAVKPAAARVVPPSPTSAANSQHRSVMDASKRLSQSGRVEDALALLQARRKG